MAKARRYPCDNTEKNGLKMKKMVKRTIVVLVILAVILAAVLLVRHRKSELASLAPPAVRPIPVHIRTATSGSLSMTEYYLGTIEPVVEAILSAQATGYLISIQKDVGDRVTAGESVAEIDSRLPAAQKSALAAELAGAQEDAQVRKTILDRRKELFAYKAISKESLDEARSAYELAFSRVQRLKQELESARVSLSFVSIRSFSEGVITERMKDPGDIVMPGTPVFKVEDRDQGYKVIVRVPQETAAQLSADAPLRLTRGVNAGAYYYDNSDNFNNAIDATIYRIHPSISSGNLATVEIRIPDRPFGLPTYGTVGVDLIVGMPEGLVVSSDCILEQATGAMVFVVEDNQHVRPVPVTLLGRRQDLAVVRGALPPGTRLAAGPESMLLQLGRHGRIAPISGNTK